MTYFNFIGGEFLPAQNNKTFSKLSPFDGSPLGTVADSDPLDFIMALQQAKKAGTLWREQGLSARAHLLEQLAEYLLENAETIAFEEALHQGLTQKFVLENSVLSSVDLLNALVLNLRNFSGGKISVQPSGVVAIIVPWALSLKLIVQRLAPALAAGNSIVIKVSPDSPVTAEILGSALKTINAPPGLVNILHGREDIGELIASHPGVRCVSAVGRNATVESISKSGVAQFKKLQLSGGAKNPGAVLSDFDFKSQMQNILAPFLLGQGQLCWNISRLFVPEAIVSEFMSAAADYLSTLRPSTGPKDESLWTPLISKPACEYIQNHVTSGVAEHGKVVQKNIGYQDHPGFFVKPTLMLDLSNCSVLQQDELHGPLLLVTAVKYQHEISKWANMSYLGQAAILWGGSEKIEKVAAQIEYSYIWQNRWMNRTDTQPLFGFKQSSFGNVDMNWAGSFYSDVKKLADGL